MNNKTIHSKNKTLSKKMECPHCGVQFSPKRSGNVFCSIKCGKIARAKNRVFVVEKRHEKTCGFCGKLFKTSSKNAAYCSNSCGQRIRRGVQLFTCNKCGIVYYKKIGKECWRCNGKGEKRNCFCCGKQFLANSAIQKHCSSECRNKIEQKTKRERRAKTTKSNQVNCRQCGKSFVSRYKNAAFCGNECRNIFKRDLKRTKRKEVAVKPVSAPKTSAKLKQSQPVVVLPKTHNKPQKQLKSIAVAKAVPQIFIVSEKILCKRCQKEVLRIDAFADCCSSECLHEITQIYMVKVLEDSEPCAGMKCTVRYNKVVLIGGKDRLVESTEFGKIESIKKDVAGIRINGNLVYVNTAEIETKKDAIKKAMAKVDTKIAFKISTGGIATSNEFVRI